MLVSLRFETSLFSCDHVAFGTFVEVSSFHSSVLQRSHSTRLMTSRGGGGLVNASIAKLEVEFTVIHSQTVFDPASQDAPEWCPSTRINHQHQG